MSPPEDVELGLSIKQAPLTEETKPRRRKLRNPFKRKRKDKKKGNLKEPPKTVI